jgi:hypothetical protein
MTNLILVLVDLIQPKFHVKFKLNLIFISYKHYYDIRHRFRRHVEFIFETVFDLMNI